MATIKKWQAALNIPETKYQKWEKEAGSLSVTAWALEKQKIPAEKYFTWAMEYYNMPMLKESFFHNISIHASMWKNTRNQVKWNKYFLPIYQWENTTFAACIEPPENAYKQIITVLTSMEKLNFLWNKIQRLQDPKAMKSKEKPADNVIAIKEIKDDSRRDKTIVTKIYDLFKSKVKTSNMSSHVAVPQVMEQVKNILPESIIFSYTNDAFLPIKWSSSLKVTMSSIPTDQPSIFKIVLQSKHAYHGFVVDNPNHRQFFNLFGYSTIPKHATLVPIFKSSANQKLLGAFLGISQKTVPMESLNQIIEYCMPLSAALMQNTELQNSTKAA